MSVVTMKNGFNVPQEQHQQQQQHHHHRPKVHELYGHNGMSPHHRRQHPTMMAPASMAPAPMASSSPFALSFSTSQKRGRGGSETSTSSLSSTYQQHVQSGTAPHNNPQHYEQPQQPPVVQVVHYQQDDDQTYFSATPKKARANNYQAPRSVKPSVLSAMGTLVGGSSITASSCSGGGYHASAASATAPHNPQYPHGVAVFPTVPVRRRLSGGHLEEFLGGHDYMDSMGDNSRPRSMSF